ncbi:hypothetical protein [uncultured Vagococcus sp.]|uniref:hypothetical protein n=1 Tax=uncultured Vagococcus sp. TaxID=189676 RepID=UPI0028D7E333|nr:hypothetical protein [uncultured Vagococcus sp.]
MKSNQIGIVDKIRVIKTYPDMLVRFTLVTSSERINCIVTKKELAQQLLFIENGQTEIACFGHVSKTNKLVIDKMTIRNPTSFLMAFAMQA